MRSRRAAFSLLAGLALVASLGVKAQVMRLATSPDVTRFNREMVARLEAQGFAAGIDDKVLELDLVTAQRSDCRLVLRSESSADLAESFRKVTRDLPVRHYRYGGELLADYPRGVADLSAFASNMALRLGLLEGIEFPLAIAASRACNLSTIEFGPQETHFRAAPAA